MAKAKSVSFVVNLSEKEIRGIAQEIVEGNVSYDFDTEVLKAAGVSTKALVDELIADPVFQKRLAKQVQELVFDNVGYLYDDMVNDNYKPLINAYKLCDKANEKLEATRFAREKADRIKRAKAVLEEEGYTVSK